MESHIRLTCTRQGRDPCKRIASHAMLASSSSLSHTTNTAGYHRVSSSDAGKRAFAAENSRGQRNYYRYYYYCYYPYLHYRKLRATIEYRDCYTTRLGPANSLFYLHARTGSPYGAVVAGKVKQTLACSDLCRGMQTEHCAMTAEKTMKSK